MFKFQKRKCTAQVMGKIVKKRWNGNIWVITVAYEVDGVTYKRREQVTYHCEKVHKIGSIPVGAHWTAALEDFEVGTPIKVNYNPDKPKRSYLPENNGKPVI